MTLLLIFNFIISILYRSNSFASAVQFTFIPSPVANIGVYQLTRFQCLVDHIDVIVSWKVNGTGSGDNNVVKLGIITNGAGSPNSSLTIPGYPQYNNTVVRCNAFGSVNGNNYFNFGDSTLRMQGKLTNVVNLACKRQQHTCAICTWSPPFSLVPIPGYVINVTKVFNGEISQNFTTDTNWTFCISPNQFGNYTVSVAGNNTAGEGDTSSMTIEINTESLDTDDYNITAKNISGNWNLTINIKNKDIWRKQHSHLQVHLNDGTLFIIKNATETESTLTREINIGRLPDNKRWKLSFRLEYSNGFLINTLTSKEFTTFNVQDGDLMEMKSESGEVCFICDFVYGSQARGCYIEYVCTHTGFNGNVAIKRKVDAITASQNVSGIHTSDYNVTFYDLDHNHIIYKDDYAVKLVRKSVTGLSSTPASTNVILSFPSPTTQHPDGDSMVNIKGSSVNVFAVVAVPIVLAALSSIVILHL